VCGFCQGIHIVSWRNFSISRVFSLPTPPSVDSRTKAYQPLPIGVDMFKPLRDFTIAGRPAAPFGTRLLRQAFVFFSGLLLPVIVIGFIHLIYRNAGRMPQDLGGQASGIDFLTFIECREGPCCGLGSSSRVLSSFASCFRTWLVLDFARAIL